MKTTIYRYVLCAALLFTAASYTAYPQEAASKASSANLNPPPSQERIPHIDQPGIPPEYFIPPIESPASSTAAPVVSVNAPPFKAPLVSRLEHGKWYVQIGVYAKAVHVDDAVRRAGSKNPVVVHNAGTDANPMFRVLLGPFSQSEGKTVLRRFKNKGYDAFLRKGN
jgi:cell division septation protein DedD